jgi:hypothetical protein
MPCLFIDGGISEPNADDSRKVGKAAKEKRLVISNEGRNLSEILRQTV